MTNKSCRFVSGSASAYMCVCVCVCRFLRVSADLTILFLLLLLFILYHHIITFQKLKKVFFYCRGFAIGKDGFPRPVWHDYSYRKLSIGLSFAALIAGITPEANPTTTATVTDNITGQIENGTS